MPEEQVEVFNVVCGYCRDVLGQQIRKEGQVIGGLSPEEAIQAFGLSGHGGRSIHPECDDFGYKLERINLVTEKNCLR